MPFNDPGLAIDMNFEGIEGLIGNRGVQVIHEMSMPCACITTSTTQGAVGSAKPGCTICNGKGYTYDDAVRMDGLLANLTFTRNFVQLGWVKPGDLSFAPSLHARVVSDFDKITLTTPVPVEPQIIVRGQESALTPRPAGQLADLEDLLLWEAGREFALRIKDEDGKVYRNTDHRCKGYKIIWTPGAGPAVGKTYTIKYMAFMEYIAWTTPVQRWDRDRSIGQRVMLRAAVVTQAVKQIIPPWVERVDDNAPRSDNDYTDNEIPTLRPPR